MQKHAESFEGAAAFLSGLAFLQDAPDAVSRVHCRLLDQYCYSTP